MTDYSNCKNIIFDFGGVLLDIDYKETEVAFQNLQSQGNHAGFSQSNQLLLFNQIETGAIDASTFRQGLRDLLDNQNVSDQELDEAWSALLGDLRINAISYLRNVLKDHKRIFLLSNINEIHLSILRREMEKSLGSVAAFEGVFESVYYSHELGLRKPDPKIFQKVLRDHDLKAEETLFIDDSIQHIESARSLGIVSHWLQGSVLDLKLADLDDKACQPF